MSQKSDTVERDIVESNTVVGKTSLIFEYNSDDDCMLEYLNDDNTNDNNINQKCDENNNNDNNDVNNEKGKRLILGIDLGTTNSCISIWRNNNCEIIPDEHGNKTIPSYVSFTNVSKYVGMDAKRQKDINVENVFYETKRLIGRRYDEKTVQDCKNLLSYNIVENDRKCVSIQSTVRDNKKFTPEEISSYVLMKLKDMAKRYLKREITDVVITVPAHFNDSQRQATYDAAKIAGLNCVRMFHEPTAAALAYGMLDRSINKHLNNEDAERGMLVIVYDFGGGTLDISLIDILNGCFDVKGSSGISFFGGVDFDNRLMTYCITKFNRQYYKTNEIVSKEIPRLSMQRLRLQCESAKKILSTSETTHIAIPDFYDGKDLFVKITRSEFEKICLDLFLLCIHPIDELLNECGYTENDIDEVILVGGMTRMPYIRQMLNNKFRDQKKSKINCSINPDEAVSVGAAIQGYIIANKDDPFSDSVTLLDVTPLSLGVEVIGGVMDIIIPRNTMIPCESTKLYSTDTDYVDSVSINIYEGERAITMMNYKIGEFELHKIPIEQRGVPEIEITFSIDVNGMVTVTAKEREINEEISMIINTNKNGLKPYEIEALINEAQEQEIIDEIDRVKKFNYYEISDLCCNIINNINDKNFKLTKTDIEFITNDINRIKKWLKDKKYSEREISEYDSMLSEIKKNYGVLIIHGKIEKNTVKANTDTLNATTLYGDNDDEEENEMKDAFEKVINEEIGGEGMTDNDLLEIKESRKLLIDLCNDINGIIHSGKLNVSNDHKTELMHYIDDIMMWCYSHEKPTKKDYVEKIDLVNSMCDEIIEKYEKEGKKLFNMTTIESDNDTNAQKLEKLCLMLLTMIDNKHIRLSKKNMIPFKNKIDDVITYIYSSDKDNNYEEKCKELIGEINILCDNAYNLMSGINLNNTIIYDDENCKKVIENDALHESFNNKQDGEGMSVMELLRIKQNEEIDEMIEEQLNDE
jgi:heat shock protein 1/8